MRKNKHEVLPFYTPPVQWVRGLMTINAGCEFRGRGSILQSVPDHGC